MQFNIFEDWLKTNKISEQVQSDFGIHFTNEIVIPVHDADGVFLFNKYRRSPTSDIGPKYRYDKGGKVELYGYHKAKEHNTILITEGEKDCLVAWSHNIPAVTSTGGAQSFQKEWEDLFMPQEDGECAKDIIICYDNDQAGADGMVKTLEILPWAKVLFLPDIPNVKDISDYVNAGGNLHELLKTAKEFQNIQDVRGDQLERIALFKTTLFHDAYIKTHTKINTYTERKAFKSDEVTYAKAYPIPNLLKFTADKACCPFHNEKTPSLHYYKNDNRCYCFGGCGRAYDVIDIYRKLTGATFKKAVDDLNSIK